MISSVGGNTLNCCFPSIQGVMRDRHVRISQSSLKVKRSVGDEMGTPRLGRGLSFIACCGECAWRHPSGTAEGGKICSTV